MKTGYFQLHLFLEKGGEKHIYQNGRPNEFELNNKVNNGPWVRVRKPSEYRVQWTSDTSRMWGEPLNLSSIFTIDENAIRPRRGTSQPLPVSIDGTWNWEDPTIDTETLEVTSVNTATRTVTMESTSGIALREMQSREQLAQRFPSHRDHVRSHQEEMNRLMQQQAEALMHRNEMERRAAQREAEQRRQEEERNRQRRPWERVRNFFGRD